MRKAILIVLFVSLFFGLALANNGKGPGDGIPDGQKPGAGFGSPGTGKGEGPGAGKVDSGGSTSLQLENLEEEAESSEPLLVRLMNRLLMKIQNAFKNIFGVGESVSE
ncbi:hypothetical protein [Mesotoga sp. UBA5825]|uniref:hypothetical protein n=1 Tax=Mesotoga sp. UBA5825 TaxID=1946858 RepID=UPI0025D5C9A2|nr:hypothetical protein [Mesotoga sp. UBA5825]